MKTIFVFLISITFAKSWSQSTSAEFDSVYALRLDQKLANLASVNKYKGLSAAILVPGQGIWVGTWGEADYNKPVTPDMRFGIASNSKAIVAALILKLQEEGLLSLDDKISTYLPSHKFIDDNITIRQLLTHTSGLFDYINDWSWKTKTAYRNNPDYLWSFEALLSTIGPPKHPPGLRYSYSNTNYLLLGMIAEAATNMDIQELLKTKIFDPLNVNMIFPTNNDVYTEPYANVWTRGEFFLDPGESKTFLSFPSTAGAIWSTAFDMVRWYDALFSGNWLSPESQQELMNYDGYVAYGPGLRIRNIFGTSIFYHAGAWGFRSYMLHDPASGISLCLLSNKRGKSVSDVAQSLFLEAVLKKPKKPYDLVVKNVTPEGTVCNLNDTQSAFVFNKGTLDINQLKFFAGIDGIWQDSTITDIIPPLSPSANQSFPLKLNLKIPDREKHEFQFLAETDLPDDYSLDNSHNSEFRFSGDVGLTLPFHEDFEDETLYPESLTSLSSNNLLDWRKTEFVSFSGNKCFARNNYRDENKGAKYTFELPLLNLFETNATLSFIYAHASNTGKEKETLKGYISTDCGVTFDSLFEMKDFILETGSPRTSMFRPTDYEWGIKNIDLGEYKNEQIIIQFELENDFGNITYIDDIKVEGVKAPNEQIVEIDLNVYPNPTTDYAIIDFPENKDNVQLNLMDAYGRTIRNYNIEKSQQIKILKGQLPAGIYYLNLIENKEVIYRGKILFLS